VGIWIERSGGLQWLQITYAHTYAIVIPRSIGKKESSSEFYYGCYILRRPERRATKQVLYQEAEGLLNDSKSEEHLSRQP
jgi:hypothetical protein